MSDGYRIEKLGVEKRGRKSNELGDSGRRERKEEQETEEREKKKLDTSAHQERSVNLRSTETQMGDDDRCKSRHIPRLPAYCSVCEMCCRA